MQHYNAALQLDPKCVAVLGNCSAAALMLKRYEDVISNCMAIIEVEPSYIKAYSRMSKAQLGLSNFAEALKWAREACGREPGSAVLKAVSSYPLRRSRWFCF